MRFIRMATAAIVLTGLFGCVNDATESANSAATEEVGEFDWLALLATYSDRVLVPTYRDFAEEAQAFAGENGRIAQYCEALLESEPAADTIPVRVHWQRLMALWQRAEVMQVGPLTDNGGALRNRIYSYGSSTPRNTCAVDQAVVLAQQADFDIASRSFNARGLGALEYLLFSENLDHTCPSQVVQTQDWNARSELQRRQWRCAYSQLVAADVLAAADRLTQHWSAEGDNYRYRFVNPGDAAEQVNALSDAIFYIEKEVKDLKIGVPTGLHADCSQVVCPQAVESPYSETSLENVKQNLLAFEHMLNGNQGTGFDDVIVAAGFPEVVEQFEADIDLALAIIERSQAFSDLYGDPPASLLGQVQSIETEGDSQTCRNIAANPRERSELPACALHGALKRITDRLRTDFITIVNLDLPERAQSDND